MGLRCKYKVQSFYGVATKNSRTFPEAAYIYSTVKVITAAPVTDRDGNLACGIVTTSQTASTTTYTYTDPNDTKGTALTTETDKWEEIEYTGFNTNAQAYFGAHVAGIITTWI